MGYKRRQLPRPVEARPLRVPRPRLRLPHEGARLGVDARKEATVALAYLDAIDGGADPRAAEAAAEAVAVAQPRSNREIARNSRVETPDEENLRLLKHAVAEGLPKKEPGAQGTAKAQQWGTNLSTPERRGQLLKMGTSSPEILKELACLQMRKRRTKKYEYPFKLREAAF